MPEVRINGGMRRRKELSWVRVEKVRRRRRRRRKRRRQQSRESFSLKQFQYLLPHTSYNTPLNPAPPTTVNIGTSKEYHLKHFFHKKSAEFLELSTHPRDL